MRAWLVCIIGGSIACGARSEIASPPPRPLCLSGDAPVLLRTWDEPWVHAITTDGREVFVSESSAPSVWAINVNGGPVIPFDTEPSPLYSIGTPLFAWNDGLYFDTWRHDDAFPLRWAPDDAASVQSISTSNVLAFDLQRKRVFDDDATLGFMLASVSLSDGTRTSIVPSDGGVLGNVVASSRFLHVVVLRTNQFFDRRMDLTSGVLDEVPMGDSSGMVSTGDGACFESAGDVMCIADDATAPVLVAKGAAGLSSADANWVRRRPEKFRSRLARGRARGDDPREARRCVRVVRRVRLRGDVGEERDLALAARAVTSA
ncbi:MAG TPA: hypothetical protein VH054_27325 [Polyangiaceae bacterium]|jgi:hypothetical protein|nr:hypothetical protein [Polyangiaceae bacterium]